MKGYLLGVIQGTKPKQALEKCNVMPPDRTRSQGRKEGRTWLSALGREGWGAKELQPGIMDVSCRGTVDNTNAHRVTQFYTLKD
jgi:hypothetical protein